MRIFLYFLFTDSSQNLDLNLGIGPFNFSDVHNENKIIDGYDFPHLPSDIPEARNAMVHIIWFIESSINCLIIKF